MDALIKTMNRTLVHQRQVFSSVLRISYSTVPTDNTTITNNEADTAGFGFSAEDLSNAKPFTDIPSPKMYPIIGNMLAYKPFGDLELYDRRVGGALVQERYGSIMRLSFPLMSSVKNLVQILDPDDFEIVYRNEGRYPSRTANPVLYKYRKERNQSLGLFLANGEDWWKFRQPLNPGMMKVNAANPYAAVQDLIGNELVSTLKQKIHATDDNIHPMIMEDISRYAMESVCAIVFDKRLGCMDIDFEADSWQQQFIDSVHDAFRTLVLLAHNPLYRIFDAVGYKSKQQRIFENSMGYITDTSLRLVQQSKDEWINIPEAELRKKFLPQLLNIQNISIEDKLSVIFDMLFAAIDTTTYTTLTNCFYLAKNPEVQEKLFIEINEHGGEGTSLNAATFKKMPYLRACIKESNRMKPIATVITRQLLRDIVIKGYRIPKDTIVLIEQQYVSNISKYVSDPESFNPDRWIRSKIKEGKKLHPFLVLPFGFGPRMCIGKRFAEQELNVAIIKLVQNFHIEFVGDTLPLKGIGLDKLPVKLNFRLHER